MAEITGGELGFEFTLDAENLKKGLTDSEGKLMGFTEVAEKAGTALQSSFDKSGSSVKDFTGIVRENVSIQKQVIKELESQIKEVQNRASGMAPGIGQATILNEAKALEKELAGEKAALADLELAMGKAATTSTTLGTKLAEAKNRLAELNLASKEGKEVTAEQFREAEAEVKKYGEAISDTNARAKALTAGTIGSLAQGLSLVTGTMAVGTSLMGAFGGKSEELNQIMVKTQALLAATVTLQEIKNTTVQKGGVISGIMAVQEMARSRATNLATAGTLRATIAQRALNMVANANPYLLLATAIMTVVGAIAIYTLTAKSAANTQKLLNDAIKQGTADTAKEIIGLERSYKTATNDKLNREQRLKAVKDLKKEFPGLFSQIDNEIILNGKAANSYLAVRDAIMKSARAKAASSIIEKKTEDLLLSQEEAKLKVAEKLSRIQKLEAAKKSGAKTMKVDFADIGTGYSGTVDIDEQLKIQKSGLNTLLKGVTKGAQDFKKANSGLIKVIEDGQTAMFDATNTPIVKGTDAYWQSEIERLEELKSKTQTGSKAWKEYGDQIKAIQDKINPPKEKVAPKEKLGNQIAEILPKESIAELQQRVSLYDDAINKAVNGEVKLRTLDKYGKDKDRKGNPFFTGEVATVKEVAQRKFDIEQQITELQKEAQIKTLEERAAAQEKYNQAYLIIAEKYGKEEADKMYGPLMEGTKSFYEWLILQRTQLEEKQKGGLLTEKDKTDLVFFISKINELEGKKNAFQNFTDSIDEALAKIPTLSGQLEFLNNKKEERKTENPKSYDDSEQKYLEEQQDALLKKQKDNYQQFLNEHKSFEEKRLKITEDFNVLRDQAAKDLKKGAITEPVYQEIIVKINKEESKSQVDLFFDEMARSEEWAKMFTDMNTVTSSKLEEFKRILQQKLSDAKTIEEKIKIGEFIKRIDDTLIKRNPLQIFSESVQNYITKLKSLKEAQEAYDKALAEYGKNSNQAYEAAKKLKATQEDIDTAKKEVASKLSEGAAEALGYINDVKGIISDVQGAFDDLGLSLDNGFGDILDKMQGALDGMEQQLQGVMQIAEGIASGNPVKVVAGVVKSIAGLIKTVSSLFNNDRKKEREIKKQAAALKQLEISYNDLAFAAEKAYGSMKYKGQTDVIKNLQQQQVLIQNMMAQEQSKKKKDNDKIAGFQQQLQSINQQIANIKEGIIKDVLQTDVVDAAAKVGDALVDAFGRGEDAVKSLENAAQDMIKNLLRNQLNLALQNKMKPILDALLASSGFNQDGTGSFTGLTPEQIAAFKAQVVAAGQSMNSFLEGYSEIFAGLETPSQGLKGDIKGITEKTAGALEAQINAMRTIQAEMHNIGKNNQQTFLASLQNLIMIEANTRRLHNIDKTLEEMNGKMKKGLAGLP